MSNKFKDNNIVPFSLPELATFSQRRKHDSLRSLCLSSYFFLKAKNKENVLLS